MAGGARADGVFSVLRQRTVRYPVGAELRDLRLARARYRHR